MNEKFLGDAFITTVEVSVWINAMHNWPDAPTRRAFLNERHRHRMRIRVGIEVDFDDRATEFFDLQEAVIAALDALYEKNGFSGSYELGERSCEMVAKELLRELKSLRYCKVSEDGENQAIVRRV